MAEGAEGSDRGVALVTGGGRGIGAATARLLARRGLTVCVNYRQDNAAADGLVAEIEAAGGRAAAVRADVADAEAVEQLSEACDALGGPLRVLVNNAGIVAEKSRVDEMSPDRLERMFSVNAVGPFMCARAAVRRMSTRYGGAGGVIVNVSSVASRIASPGEYVDYAASKAALDVLTRGLAIEVATEGIRVNAVRPGIVETDIHASGGQPDRAARMAHLIPMQRPGRAEEIAEAIDWLASDASSYASGAILDVSGGR